MFGTQAAWWGVVVPRILSSRISFIIKTTVLRYPTYISYRWRRKEGAQHPVEERGLEHVRRSMPRSPQWTANSRVEPGDFQHRGDDRAMGQAQVLPPPNHCRLRILRHELDDPVAGSPVNEAAKQLPD